MMTPEFVFKGDAELIASADDRTNYRMPKVGESIKQYVIYSGYSQKFECCTVQFGLDEFWYQTLNDEKEKLRYAYKNVTYEVPTNWFVQRAPALYDGFYYYPEHGMLYVTHQNIEKSGIGPSASEQQVLETVFSGMKDSIPNHHLVSKEKFSILGKDGLKATLTGMPADKNCTINIVAYVDQTGVMAFMMATYNEEVQEGAYEKDFRRILDSVEVLQSA